MRLNPPFEKATFIKRYKRFLADVRLADGQIITVHCPNTGSMKNCLLPETDCWLSKSTNTKRKYAYTWEIASVPGNQRAGINTGRANSLVREALDNQVITELAGYQLIRQEVKIGSQGSRIDFVLERHPRKRKTCYLEVKSVTYGEAKGRGLFPDAISDRATKHIHELIALSNAGHRAVLLFCVQHSGIKWVEPADEIDPVYGQALRQAATAGVELIAYKTKLSAKEILLTEALPVKL